MLTGRNPTVNANEDDAKETCTVFRSAALRIVTAITTVIYIVFFAAAVYLATQNHFGTLRIWDISCFVAAIWHTLWFCAFVASRSDDTHLKWFLFGAIRFLALGIAIAVVEYTSPADQVTWVDAGSPVTLTPQPHLDDAEVRAANAHIDVAVQTLVGIALNCSLVETLLCYASLRKLFCNCS